MPVIGFLHFGSPDGFAYQIDALRHGLAENGYVDGKNVAIETRWAEGHLERLPALAADLVAVKVDVIVAAGPPPAKAAKNTTLTIAIVFSVGVDPVAEGLVASLAHPGASDPVEAIPCFPHEVIRGSQGAASVRTAGTRRL